MTSLVGETTLRDLRQHLAGRVLTPDDGDYDDARALFNAMIDVYPAVIAQCAHAEDVRAALRFAHATGLPAAVRAGGHSVAGASTVQDGLVIDVRPMRDIEVDAAARTVRCGAGVTWADLDAATQAHGLAVTGGRASTTGVAGFPLGGGSGWIERRYGLTCDNLIAVEIVTADGRVLRASDDSHPDLFCALHGGGGNFGVATAFELRLHEVGPTVMAGLMLWPAARGRDVLRALRDMMDSGPEELSGAGIYLYGPPEPFVPPELQGELLCGIALIWYGSSPEDGEPYARVFRDLSPAVDLVGPMPYVEFQRMIDDPPGMRNYWSADFFAELGDEALEVFIGQSERMPAPSQSLLAPWGGAVGRAPEGATPLAKRDAKWVTHPFAIWEDPADDAAHVAWAKQISAALRPYSTGGTYLNWIGDEGEDRIRAAYGENFERLARVKASYDPGNFFRRNQNVRPAVAAG
jgi:FAD/FMN-containing dehydrogenase